VPLRDAFHIVALAVRWTRPFARRFALKASLVVTSIAVLLMLPIPAKILIDHVVLAQPVESERNPLVRVPLLWLGLTDPATIFWATAGFLVALLVLAGAIGPGGAETEPTQAWVGGGVGIAPPTENGGNAGLFLAAAGRSACSTTSSPSA